MTDGGSDIRRLRELVEEVKAARVPNIQWVALEQELFSELEGQTPSASLAAPRHPRYRRGRIAWGLLAAAGAALAFGGHALWNSYRQPTATQTVASARTFTSPRVDNAQAKVGDRFVASHSDITITDARLGKWVLSSGGEATLVRKNPLVIQLSQGELLAEITPGLGPDIFAVEAAQTRVVVKGTIFRVRRSLDHVHVDLMRGEVAVSSLGTGRQTFSLRAPASGDFALDASSGQVWEPSVASLGAKAVNENEGTVASESTVASSTLGTEALNAAPPHAEKAPPKVVRGREQPPVIPIDLPLTLSLSQATTGVDALIQRARDCLYSSVENNGEQLSSTFVTEARLLVDPQGAIAELELSPPLLPKADTCLRKQLQALNFGQSQKGAELFRRLELERSPR